MLPRISDFEAIERSIGIQVEDLPSQSRSMQFFFSLFLLILICLVIIRLSLSLLCKTFCLIPYFSDPLFNIRSSIQGNPSEPSQIGAPNQVIVSSFIVDVPFLKYHANFQFFITDNFYLWSPRLSP